MTQPHFNGPLAHLVRSLMRLSPPDPWPAELDDEIREGDALPLCIGCLCPQPAIHWLCPHCGFPSGNYTTTMPYLYVLVDGELFRRGVSGPPEPGVGRQLFLVLYSAATYHVFAPLYWFWMYRKAQGRPIVPSCRREYAPFANADSADPGSP